jgi:hypothetical protein
MHTYICLLQAESVVKMSFMSAQSLICSQTLHTPNYESYKVNMPPHKSGIATALANHNGLILTFVNVGNSGLEKNTSQV